MTSTPDENSYPEKPTPTYEPPKRSQILILEEGQQLVMDYVTIALKKGSGGGAIDVTCECVKANPDTPDCTWSVTPFEGGFRVTCTPVRGCISCKAKGTVVSRGVVVEPGLISLY